MRFHKSESALIVFIVVILTAGIATFHAYMVINDSVDLASEAARLAEIQYLRRLLFATGVLLATALFFGVFFIYPLIRRQVNEHGRLSQMTESLSARSVTLEQAALTDALTGIKNRRYFDDAVKEYLSEFRRIGKPIGLMILDLDHFKQINDTHGHNVGDEVLKAVAKCLRDLTRYHDIVARVGGEEFAVVAPNLDAELLLKLAERIRKAVSGVVIMSGNVRLKITTSVGLAVWDGRESADSFFSRADKRLYEAKKLGRNRVCA